MWHEARKHEKKLRVFIVDYRRRAERRREFYEKFKADPTQFMQVHGRPCKIYMDPQITAAAENCLQPWQGDVETKIDRCDARALLDRIPEYSGSSQEDGSSSNGAGKDEETELNYERYRILIQNELAGISEDKFLHQIYIEEQFGTPVGSKGASTALQPKIPKAAISYNYDDGGGSSAAGPSIPKPSSVPLGLGTEDPDEESDEDIDFDLLVNVKDLTAVQQTELNNGGLKYGLHAGDFMRYLNADLEEKEQMRLAKLQEEEKQTMSGRKARRERRAYKDKIIMRKGHISPPSYAARKNTGNEEQERGSTSRSPSGSKSRSRSASVEKIQYITSFGGTETDDDKKRAAKTGLVFGPALPPVLSGLRKRKLSKSPDYRRNTGAQLPSKVKDAYKATAKDRSAKDKRHRSNSSDRGTGRKRSGSYSRRSSYRSRSRSRSRRRRSRSRSWGRRRNSRRSYSRSSSRSSSRRNKHSRRSLSGSRSPSKHRSRGRRSKSRSHSRSPRRRKRSTSTSSSSSSSSGHSRSRKRSSSRRESYARRSASPTKKPGNADGSKLPSPPVKRYYDRAKAIHQKQSSEEELMSSDSEDEPRNSQSRTEKSTSQTSQSGKANMSISSKGSTSFSAGSSSSLKLTPQERLKRKMQLQLSRTLKADKEAEKSRLEKKDLERLEREESLRELSIKYRRREREKRHRNQNRTDSSRSDCSSRSSRSSSRSRSPYYEF